MSKKKTTLWTTARRATALPMLGAAAAALLLSACGNYRDEEPAAAGGQDGGVTIRVSIDDGTTRAAAASRTSAFNDGDTFLAYMPGAASRTSAVYQVTSGATATVLSTAFGPLTAPTVDGTKLYGYFPYSTGMGDYGGVRVTNASASFTVQADQSGADGYEQSDMMVGTGTVSTIGQGTLTFKHRMAQLVLKPYLVNTTGYTVSMTSLAIVSGSRTVSLLGSPDLTVGAPQGDALSPGSPLTVFSGGSASLPTAAASATPYYCLFPPQVLESGTAFIRLEGTATATGGSAQKVSVTYRIDGSQRLLSGSSYTLSLPVTPVSATVSLTDWTVNEAWQLNTTAESGHYTPQANMAFTVGGVPFNMVYVEGGSMQNLHSMQATSAYNSGYHVTMSDYYMAETETTRGLWKALVGGLYQNTTGSPGLQLGAVGAAEVGSGDDLPVYGVYYDNILLFIDLLNSATESQRPAGWVFALPTSAQFEYAARGGQRTQGYKYAGFDNVANAAEYMVIGQSMMQPVASKKPNELGLYDMQGSMYEVCCDYMPSNRTTQNDENIYGGITAGTYADPFMAGNSTDHWYFGPGFQTDADTYYNNWGYGVANGAGNYSDAVRGFRVALVKRKPRVGDLYFSDGTWGTKEEWPVKAAGSGTVKPIGIVFSTDMSAADRAAGYYNGYAMALKDATTKGLTWADVNSCGPYNRSWPNLNSAALLNSYRASASYMDGRSETAAIRATVAAAELATKFPTVNAAVNYVPDGLTAETAAPSVSSSWYLPSLGQQWEILRNLGGLTAMPNYFRNTTQHDAYWNAENVTTTTSTAINTAAANSLTNASTQWDQFLQVPSGSDTSATGNSFYYSSTEQDARYVFGLYSNAANTLYLHSGGKYVTGYQIYCVRPVLAF